MAERPEDSSNKVVVVLPLPLPSPISAAAMPPPSPIAATYGVGFRFVDAGSSPRRARSVEDSPGSGPILRHPAPSAPFSTITSFFRRFPSTSVGFGPPEPRSMASLTLGAGARVAVGGGLPVLLSAAGPARPSAAPPELDVGGPSVVVGGHPGRRAGVGPFYANPASALLGSKPISRAHPWPPWSGLAHGLACVGLHQAPIRWRLNWSRFSTVPQHPSLIVKNSSSQR